MDEDIEAYNKMGRKIMGQGKRVVEFLSKQECVKLAYLFGSYAKGKVKPFSDMDICVITERNISKEVKEGMLSNSSKRVDTFKEYLDFQPIIKEHCFRIVGVGE